MRAVRHPLLLGAGVLAALAAARPWLRHWGTTCDDLSRVLPGDWLIDGERGVSTMAITIDAPFVAVWPWLAQMVTVPGRSWFDVVHVEPHRSLVLRATLDGRGRPYDPARGRPRVFVDARWEFFLDPLTDGSTRLIVRSGSAAGPRPWSDLLDLLFWHPAHVVMQIRQLRRLKLRAEQQATGLARGELRREVVAGIS